ncbi:MAG: 8-amino-7-oxononanoate synthase [Planctomycetota bacterium]
MTAKGSDAPRDFASNDYLGLRNDPRLVRAATDAAEEFGLGSGASALISGRTSIHAELEETIARFEDAEAALIFPTGYAANLGTVAALADAGTTVFCERHNHACLVDGCRLGGGELHFFRRDRLDALDDALRRASGPRLIVIDGVFSMEGEIAPLAAVCDLADRHDAWVVVDEAHGTGVLGDRGRGAAEACGVTDRIAVRTGTLSKASGCQGGFVVGSRTLIDHLWHTARTQIYSTALAVPTAAAALEAIEIIRGEPDLPARCRGNARRMRTLLAAREVTTGGHCDVPIVPINVGEPARAVEAATRLNEHGFAVAAIRPPTVPRGTSRLRISVSAAHTEDELTRLADAVAETLAPTGAAR